MGLGAALVRVTSVLAFLMLVLSPSIESTGSGSFLLPWWLGSTTAEYYPGRYLLICMALLAIFVIGKSGYKHLAERETEPTEY